MIGLDTNVLVRVLVDDGSADVTKASIQTVLPSISYTSL